jgi:phosphoglycolate phosphatase-like HAD superfamily hydrolase
MNYTFKLERKPDAILFDIDGTLIVGGNSHFPSLEYAFNKVMGKIMMKNTTLTASYAKAKDTIKNT